MLDDSTIQLQNANGWKKNERYKMKRLQKLGTTARFVYKTTLAGVW
jgi:hypothetical protein